MRALNIAITCILYFCILTFTTLTPVEGAPKAEIEPQPQPYKVSNKTIITHLHQIEVRALT